MMWKDYVNRSRSTAEGQDLRADSPVFAVKSIRVTGRILIIGKLFVEYTLLFFGR